MSDPELRWPAEAWALTLPAVWASLDILTADVGVWLVNLDWPVDEVAAIVTASHEVVCNAIEHAYPPREIPGAPPRIEAGLVTVRAFVRVDADERMRRVRLVISDKGCWDPFDCVKDRRHGGLQVAFRLMEFVSVHRGGMDPPLRQPGTIVTMTSIPVPSPSSDEGPRAAMSGE